MTGLTAEYLSLKSLDDAKSFIKARNITAEDVLRKLRRGKDELATSEQDTAVSDMKKHLSAFAPEWITELENMDSALELPENTMLESLSYALWVKEKMDCTSWIVLPELTAGGKMLLHKNRDSEYSPHAPLFFRTPGKFSWLGSCSRNLPYPLMGINEKGLTVAMNSGELCAKWNRSGFGTPMIARLLLENCSTPDEAGKMVEELRKHGAYSHINRGSIFFYANSEYAGLTELCAERSQYINFDFGYMIRANAWHLPGMTGMSLQDSRCNLERNLIREYMVRDGLIEGIAAGGVTPANCIAITRNRGRLLPAGQVPVCRPTTIASGTFEIDGKYPELSTFYHLSGPARNTIALPVFAGAGALPEELVSAEWTARAVSFKERRGMDHVLLPAFEELEKELFKEHAATGARAGELLKKGASEEARKLLREHTFAQFQTAARRFREITGV